MKCINCGLPLAPRRSQANCPRCGMPTAPDQEYGELNDSQSVIPTQQAGYGYVEEVSSSGSKGVQTSQAALQTQPPVPSILTWEPVSPTPLQLTYSTQPQQTLQYDLAKTYKWPGVEPRSHRHSSDISLIVAGLCVFTGALILLFVYFMAMGLSSDTPGADRGAPPVLTNTPSAPSPSPIVSSTATDLPGEQYIDKAQTASTIDFKTAKVIEPASVFNVNQKIYVTFHLHPNGQAGAVCLSWYLNGRKISQLEFSVSYNSRRTAYSYAIYNKPGSGSVNIYWASSTDCTDKLLAQQVSFNVIG